MENVDTLNEAVIYLHPCYQVKTVTHGMHSTSPRNPGLVSQCDFIR